MKEINEKKLNNSMLQKAQQDYQSLLERIKTVNNFFEAIAMKEESDRLKIRWFKNIQAEYDKINTPKISQRAFVLNLTS